MALVCMFAWIAREVTREESPASSKAKASNVMMWARSDEHVRTAALYTDIV
jgi:hypothetical protein